LRALIALVYTQSVSKTHHAEESLSPPALPADVATLQAENVQLRAEMVAQHEALQTVITGLKDEVQILLRRLYGNRTERTNTTETQFAFELFVKDEKELQKKLEDVQSLANKIAKDAGISDPGGKSKPRGRRNLEQSNLPRIEVEVPDPEFEGKFPRAGFETSYQLYRQRSTFAVLVKKIAKYTVTDKQGKTAELSAEQPLSLINRGLLHTSAIADIIVRKFSQGEPLYRQEQHYAAEDASLDRGTMCRYVEEAGNALGATVVHAMWQDALKNAGVISTDATGALIQPENRNQVRQSCNKGHFFVAVVDDASVLFHYVPKHTQVAVKTLFDGYRGFLQADAHHVYNVLERPPPGETEPPIRLVGCWAHCRRYFFEAAICRYQIGVQGLMRIRAIYILDRAIMKLPRSKRTALREEKVRPLMVEFFAWARDVKDNGSPRSRAAQAVGYATNQESELMAVLENPDLPLDNTRSERALRKIVVGRKNWLFYGSDGHAEAAAALFTLIATCRIYRIEPTQYLDELMRVVPYWPRDRLLELAPQHWNSTRAKLDPAELARFIGRITVPAA
jgi:transposase